MHRVARFADGDLQQTLIDRSSKLVSVARRSLGSSRAHIDRSRALVREARAVCARADAALAAPSPLLTPSPAPAAPLVTCAREELRCIREGCARRAPLKPCFVVEQGERRILVSDMPLRVCSEHRVDLQALFRHPSALDALRRRFHANDREEPHAVHLVFEVVD